MSEVKYQVIPKDRIFVLIVWLNATLTGLIVAEGKAIDTPHYISMTIIIILVIAGFVAGKALIIEVSPKV